MKRAKTSAAEWERRVRAWRASGESAESYATARGWSPRTLQWWGATSRGRGGGKAPAVEFVEVVAGGGDGGEGRGRAAPRRIDEGRGALEVRLTGDLRIVVGWETDLALLHAVVGALAREGR